MSALLSLGSACAAAQKPSAPSTRVASAARIDHRVWLRIATLSVLMNPPTQRWPLHQGAQAVELPVYQRRSGSTKPKKHRPEPRRGTPAVVRREPESVPGYLLAPKTTVSATASPVSPGT